MAVGALIGFVIGVLVAKLEIPSFVVTLAFFLGLQGGTLKTGRTFSFTVANGGIDIGKISKKVPKKFQKQIAAIKVKIAKNKIKIPDTVK